MGRFDGKVAVVTGAARGQGRSHALRFAQEGADIIAVDIVRQIDTVAYPMATADDLAETVRQIESLDRRVVAAQADVRDYDTLKVALDDGVVQLGRLDVVSANAGIFGSAPSDTMSQQQWDDMIAVNLTGVWHTAKAAIPHLRSAGSGAIVITSSAAGFKGGPGFVHYVASKHGVVGIMRTLALELAPDSIRVNTVHPGNVDTDMIQNDILYSMFAPDMAPQERTREALADRFQAVHALPVPWMQPSDISDAVLWLASDEARYVTGVTLAVDAGASQK